MNQYIVNRYKEYSANPDQNIEPGGRFYDTNINKRVPYSDELKIGDILFIADGEENKIYGWGEVGEIIEHKFESMNEFVDFVLYETDFDPFWQMKLKNYFKKRGDFKFIHVRIVQTVSEQLVEPAVEIGKELTAHSWVKVDKSPLPKKQRELLGFEIV